MGEKISEYDYYCKGKKAKIESDSESRAASPKAAWEGFLWSRPLDSVQTRTDAGEISKGDNAGIKTPKNWGHGEGGMLKYQGWVVRWEIGW